MVAAAGRRTTPTTCAVNAFTEASFVEHRGFAVLLPYLEERAYRGRIVSTARGPLEVVPVGWTVPRLG